MNINWNNIAAIDGQREGFEELVCQLARKEIIPNTKSFIRIGKPDGGKECFWELNNGRIHCWQAKYFIRSLKASEWSQVEESTKNAIDNHPTLTKYYVAIPVDRPDGKGRGKSMLQKWNEFVDNWKAYASKKGMNVSFEYWGKHELEVRLSKRDNEGMLYYFFNQQEISDNWFNRKNQESIDALGGRYTPELNFELPFTRQFDGLERGDRFVHQIDGEYDVLLDKYRKININIKNEDIRKESQKLKDSIRKFRIEYESLVLEGIETLLFDKVKQALLKAKESVNKIEGIFWRLSDEEEKKSKGKKIDYYVRPYGNELNSISNFSRAIDRFINYLNSVVCQTANNPTLILMGPAGQGKSHSLADFVREREERGKNSLLLLGENFVTEEQPWTQILNNQLRFNHNEEVFLGALNAMGENKQSRILLVIDAINEGSGRRIWPKRLRSFMRSLESYPWLGLVVSIRTPFDKLIAPEEIIDSTVASRIEHPGFEGVEYLASYHFFHHYKITPPSSPMLHPEFQNPLFLKLFCEGLEKRGLSEIPDGYEGISMIIGYFLESVEEKLAQSDELDYDVRLKLMQNSVDEILVKILESNLDHIPYEMGSEIVNSQFQGKCGSRDTQYLKRIISENVLNENLYWKKQNDYYYGIHFAYQRFQDHLIVSALLDKYLDESNPKESFDNGVLREIVENRNGAYYDQNLIEAFSIQVPERTGKELHEVAPYVALEYTIAYAFINGLTWRRSDTIGENSRSYVNDVIGKRQDLFFYFLDVSIALAIRPEFYFNADKLHNMLWGMSLPERDSWWTTWLQDKYGENSSSNSVKRIIDWAWDNSIEKRLSDKSIRLTSILLSWFLASSNRYLRDCASNAMVCLLQDKIPVLIHILKQFEGVNDPYVYERLFAVAYGCALRTNDEKGIADLSQYVYDQIFTIEMVIPHILLRDYARGVIEYANHLKLDIQVDMAKVRPPYKSDLPESYPTLEEIDKMYDPEGEEGNYGGKKWGATAILRSMTTEYGRKTGGYGDFGRYTFQSALRHWNVDCDKLSNVAIQKIFELGYDPEVFSDFDSRQGSGRGTGHLERIGKKYQWIVFYEILAIVADNFEMPDESYWGNKKKLMQYDGPWVPYVRDYDPTMLIGKTLSDSTIDCSNPPWWFNLSYNNWGNDAAIWMKKKDFPKIEDYLFVTDCNGDEWINLDIHPDWVEPRERGEDKWQTTKRRVWFDVSSILVKPNTLKKMIQIHSSNSSKKRWLWSIDSHSRYELFSREYLWSSGWSFFETNQYYGGAALPVALEDPDTRKIFGKGHKTTSYFMWEEEFDCSKEDKIIYLKPSSAISFDLKAGRVEGQYQNKSGELICFDPCVYEKGPSCLLIRKDYLLKILRNTGLRLVWIIQGEKQILNGHSLPKVNFDHTHSGIYYMDDEGYINGEVINSIHEY